MPSPSSSPARRRPRLGAAAAALAAGIAAATAAAWAGAAAPAAAAADGGRQALPCTGLEHLAGFLQDTYGELPVSVGLQSDGQLLQIFSSAASGSWTAVTTSPAGVACVVATGRNWEQAGDGPGLAHSPASLRP